METKIELANGRKITVKVEVAKLAPKAEVEKAIKEGEKFTHLK